MEGTDAGVGGGDGGDGGDEGGGTGGAGFDGLSLPQEVDASITPSNRTCNTIRCIWFPDQ